MAFNKGFESTESQKIKRYVGIGASYVRGVNPTKEELSKFFERDIENIPEYTSTEEVDGVQVPQARIDFLVQADPEKYTNDDGTPVDLKTRITFFLRRKGRQSKDGKWQIIDKYGRTAWATEEDIQNKRIPLYSNGKPANVDASYRKAYDGEEYLIKFLIAYLNIPEPASWINGEWVMKSMSELADSEAYLEHIEDYFKGNFAELQDIVKLMPANKVKIAYGVRRTDKGLEYQSAYTRYFLRNSSNSNAAMAKEITGTQNAGGYSTTEFAVTDLQEYNLKPVPMTQAENPFQDSTPVKSPWD